MPLFPYKLHELLTEMQSNAHLSSIISWVSQGNAFKIHEPELFEEVLLKKYFPRQTKINSFKRQLLYYGFDNLGDCMFAHPCFLKDKRHLCGQINHSNPTKSQREANTAIPSRRLRGKRAKQALRHKLAMAPSQVELLNEQTRTSPMPQVAQGFAALPAAPFLPVQTTSNQVERPSAFTQALLHSRATPLDYWRSMNTVCTPPLTSSASDFQKETPMLQSNLMSGQSRMALFAMLQQQRGSCMPGNHAVSA